jgi:hypothetical protein
MNFHRQFKKFSFLIYFAGTVFVSAQTDNDPVYINYSFFPEREMTEIPGSSTLQMLEANVILPDFLKSEKTKIYTNLNYKYSSFENELTPDNYPGTLNDFRFGFIVRQKLKENWEAVFVPRVNIRTDFEEKFSKRDLFPGLNLLVLRTLKKNENLVYGLGVSFNNDPYKNAVIPLGFLTYKNSWVRVNTILPSFAYVLLTPSPKFEYGLSFNIDTGLFHIERFSSAASPNYFQMQNITIAPTLGYNFAGDFWLNAKAGYAMKGKFRLLDADFNELELNKENKTKSGFFASVGVSLRVKEK